MKNLSNSLLIALTAIFIIISASCTKDEGLRGGSCQTNAVGVWESTEALIDGWVTVLIPITFDLREGGTGMLWVTDPNSGDEPYYLSGWTINGCETFTFTDDLGYPGNFNIIQMTEDEFEIDGTMLDMSFHIKMRRK